MKKNNFKKISSQILVYFLIAGSFLMNQNVLAQTTHINPATEGGFENGITFAANNWTTSTGTAPTNNWCVGTNATTGFTGNNAAYVSNTSTTTKTHTYTITSSATTHIFKTVTIPSGQTNIVLNFKWICAGESTYDRLKVYISPTTSTAPAYGVTQTTTTTVPTSSPISSFTHYQLAQFSGQASWQNATISIPAIYANGLPHRIVFEWKNDTSVGTQPPIAIDDVSLTSAVPAVCTTPSPTTNLVFGTINATSLPANFTGSGANGYLVIRSTSSTPPSQPVNGVTYTAGNIGTLGAGLTFVQSNGSTSITGTGLTGNTTYYYYIYAYNGTGCTGGPLYSSVLSGSGTTCPNTPTALTASAFTDSSFNLSWTQTGSTSNPITYIINVYTDPTWTTNIPGSPFLVTYPTTTYNVTGLVSGVKYYYRIRASNGCENFSASGNVTTTLCAGNPSGLSVSATDTTATVSWTAASPAPSNGYSYYVSPSLTPPSSWDSPTGTTAAGITSANLSSLLPGTVYYVWVRSECASNSTSWFGPRAFTTTSSAPITTDANICTGGTALLSASASCQSMTNIGNTINGSWNAATDPIAYQPIVFMNNSTTCSFGPNTANYTTLNFQVSTSGNYTFSMPQTGLYDGMAYITTFPYAPGSCNSGNWIIGDDDTGSGLPSEPILNNVPLAAGTTYTLITTLYFSTSQTFTGNYTWNITGPGSLLQVNSSSSVDWYTTASGGSPIGSGSTFNPVGVPGSGLSDTNTPGTYTFYAACADNPGVRTPVDLVITNGPTGVISGNGSTCDANTTINITLTGNQPWTITYTDGTTPVTISGITSSPYSFTVSPSSSTTYTLSALSDASCNAIAANLTGSAVVSGSKTWLGTSNNDWDTASNWSGNAIPTAADCIIIPSSPNNPLISGTNYIGLGKNITINNGAVLTVNSNNTLSIVDFVNIISGGDLVIENSASLVQTNNIANSGVAHIKRISQPMYRLDYTYWNSPITATSNFAVGNLTSGTNHIYRYTPTQAGGNGIWTQVPGTTPMNPTFGIIARAPGSFPTTGTKQTFTANFIGTPNNGDITMPISKGNNANSGMTVPGNSTIITDADDEWNLIGNPYPSAIDISLFLQDPANTPIVDGTIYLWTHNTAPSTGITDPFYGNYVQNYTVNDYATVNQAGATTTAPSGGATPTQYIASGQSFFISAHDSMLNGTTQSVTFKNSMRVINQNTGFLRTANPETNFNSDGDVSARQRVWLNLSGNSGFSQLLIGYIEGTTLAWDRGYDGEALAGNSVRFYSLGADKKLTIQSRFWPFDQTDIVPLGYKATGQGNYTIGIDHFDSAFNNQNIYLEDRDLGIIHDLKTAPYSFTSNIGEFENRFVLRYTNATLGSNEVDETENNISIISNQNTLEIKSTKEKIKSVKLFDLLGKKIAEYKNSDNNVITIEKNILSESIYITQIILENNFVVHKKVSIDH